MRFASLAWLIFGAILSIGCASRPWNATEKSTRDFSDADSFEQNAPSLTRSAEGSPAGGRKLGFDARVRDVERSLGYE